MSAGLEIVESWFEELERKRRTIEDPVLERLSKDAERALELARKLEGAGHKKAAHNFLADIARVITPPAPVKVVADPGRLPVPKPTDPLDCELCGFTFTIARRYCPHCGARRP